MPAAARVHRQLRVRRHRSPTSNGNIGPSSRREDTTMRQIPFRSAPPEQAIPPGRIGYDLDAPILLLHTIQTGVAYERLLSDGVLRPSPELAATEWPEAYAWMNRMMADRLPTTGDAALWLWARIRRYDLVSNCRRASRSSDPQVLLTCRIPRERVLLSQFDEWHSALNSALAVMVDPGETDESFESRFDELTDAFIARLDDANVRNSPISEWPADLRAEAESSWECIFDRRRFDRRSYWQATVHDIRAEDVTDAVTIVGAAS